MAAAAGTTESGENANRTMGETSNFYVVRHERSAPLVWPPAPPGLHSRPPGLKARLGDGSSLAMAGAVVLYAFVVWITVMIGISGRQSQSAPEPSAGPVASAGIGSSDIR